MQEIDKIQELDDITDKVCMSELSINRIEGYIDLLGDITQEVNDNKIHALLYSLELESKSQIENLSNIESQLLKYKNSLKGND